jgi:hypothetical protein
MAALPGVMTNVEASMNAIFVVPSAGTQRVDSMAYSSWIPASAGMTEGRYQSVG